MILLILYTLWKEMTTNHTWNDWKEFQFKGSIILERSVHAFIRHPEVTLYSMFAHILLAIIFGWIMGDSSGTDGIYNTVSFFAVGSLFIIFANIGLVAYMFNIHKVNNNKKVLVLSCKSHCYYCYSYDVNRYF